jgi:hypothetical protein
LYNLDGARRAYSRSAMTSPNRQDIVLAFKGLWTPAESFPWAGMWIADEKWVEYLKVEPLLTHLSVAAFNAAISKDSLLMNCLASGEENTLGFYGHTYCIERGRKTKFYYVSKDGELPSRRPDKVFWRSCFNNNKIVQSKRQQDRQGAAATTAQQDPPALDRPDGDAACVKELFASPVPKLQSKKGRIFSPSPQKPRASYSAFRLFSPRKNKEQRAYIELDKANDLALHRMQQEEAHARALRQKENAHQMARQIVMNNYWDDKKLTCLFGGDPKVPGSTLRSLLESIELLKELEKDFKGLCNVVNQADKHPIETQQVHQLIMKGHYLRVAYETALDEMPLGATWSKCCLTTIEKMDNAAFDLFKSPKTIMAWNQYFRQKKKLPHPNIYVELGKVVQPKLFEQFPEAKQNFEKWGNKNLFTLSCEKAADYIRNTLIPELYHEEMEDIDALEQITQEEFMKALNLTTVSSTTANRWLGRLNFTYDFVKKVYYNDKHESDENKDHRGKFATTYFGYELLSYRWVQVPEQDAIQLENEMDPKKPSILKNIFAFEYNDGSVKMREYHVDCCPELFFEKYVLAENKRFGGNLSRKFPYGFCNPVLLIGQDESIFKQFAFSSKAWRGSDGHSILLPKDDGYGLMISAFVSRSFPSGFVVDCGEFLTDEKLAAINARRLQGPNKHYISTDAAEEIYGTTVKKPIQDASPFCRLFEYGADREGYWNYSHMALQLEDLVDCLVILFPGHDFVFLFDQSSGHGKKRTGGLSPLDMNVDWGGAVPNMHETVLTQGCLGPFEHSQKLSAGDIQYMTYQSSDQGPRAVRKKQMTDVERLETRLDRSTETTKSRELLKKELLDQLLEKTGTDFSKPWKSKKDIQDLTKTRGYPVTTEESVVKEGWLGKPKGLWQTLWERGHIDEANAKHYKLKYAEHWLDEEGKVRDDCVNEYQKYSLTYLMSQCEDFQKEKSAMEFLAEKLSLLHGIKVELLTSTKYHCEVAGEGIEYDWGYAKKTYRRIPLSDKKGKEKFVHCVKESLRSVSIGLARKFSAKARRYMLTYQVFDNAGDYEDFQSKGLSYQEIEKHVTAKMKAHRSSADQECRYISQVWRESQQRRAS